MTKIRNNQIEMQPEAVKEMLEIPVLGAIPEDLCVSESLNLKGAVVHTHPKSKAARAYKEIAAKILGKDYDSEAEKEKIWEIILRRMKRR